MKLKKSHARVLILSSVLFFATSCTISFSSSSRPKRSSKEESSRVESENPSNPLSSEAGVSSSTQEESSSMIDPENPNKDLKRQLSSTYHEYGEHNIANFRYIPSIGSPKLLVVPVWFTNSSSVAINSAHKDDVREDIETAFCGTEEDTGWNSVKTYYQTLSDERCNLTPIVTDWWECGIDSSSAASSQSTTATLVQGAVDWYFSQPDAEPRESFDLDQDGYLDGVMLVYAAPDYRSSRSYENENLWAYCSWLPTTASVATPAPKAFLWASYDFMYGSGDAYTRTGRYYGGGDSSHVEIDAHTFIHETGHMFGFNDYYDYSQQYNPAGGFSMQDENVGSHDPYSAMAAGWVDPIIPFDSTTISIRPFQNKNHDLILITNAWNGDNSPFDEYLLLELYTPTGLNELDATYTYNYAYPKGPSDCGIRLWHVDSRLVKGRVSLNGASVTWSSVPYTDPELDGCYLMQSNTSYNSRYPEYFQSYGNVLGTSYADYNFLQLIRNNENASHRTSYGTNISNDDLFKDGSSFTMAAYSKQFVNGVKLNCKDYLGWAFDVEIDGTGEDAIATISLTKAE